MSGIHIETSWPSGRLCEGRSLRSPPARLRPGSWAPAGAQAAGLRPRPPGVLLRQVAGPGPWGRSGARCLSLSLGPLPAPPPVVPPGFFGVRAGRGGAARVSPRPLSRAGFGPSSPLRARPGPSPGRCAPVARLRPPPGAPAGALAPAALAPRPGLRGDRLAVWGPPCGALRACCARPWPSPGGPCARPRRRRVPLASALGAGAGAPSGLLPPGGCAPWRALLPPAPGRGGWGSAACGRRRNLRLTASPGRSAGLQEEGA